MMGEVRTFGCQRLALVWGSGGNFKGDDGRCVYGKNGGDTRICMSGAGPDVTVELWSFGFLRSPSVA